MFFERQTFCPPGKSCVACNIRRYFEVYLLCENIEVHYYVLGSVFVADWCVTTSDGTRRVQLSEPVIFVVS